MEDSSDISEKRSRVIKALRNNYAFSKPEHKLREWFWTRRYGPDDVAVFFDYLRTAHSDMITHLDQILTDLKTEKNISGDLSEKFILSNLTLRSTVFLIMGTLGK